LPPRSQEAEAIYKDINLIADELLARKPIDAIRPLYDHPDVDVRYWAAGLRHALTALLPLLEHPNLVTRHMAASSCLDIASDRAARVLESIVQSRDTIEWMHADYTLDKWRKKQGAPHA
jgi:hypothetical protein